MPHLVILYTPQIERLTDVRELCDKLREALLGVRDQAGRQVFPTGGVRVLAFGTTHYAVADGGQAGRTVGGSGDYGFVYLHLRMGRGRTEDVQRRVGEAIESTVMGRLGPLLETEHMGITIQVDVGAEVFDAKHSSLHPLFG